ncbi:MAG: nucleotidyltransferase domain-containing protein, partial [Nitrospirae bacterium]|nr:nucleotidyltransferase domain-containing protein [Nitrospirota bacterium]
MQEAIKGIAEEIAENLTKRFHGNLKCLILYGSWAKGTARQTSDIDLLAVFDKSDKEIRKAVADIMDTLETERSITVLSTSLEDFQKEKIPLYT